MPAGVIREAIGEMDGALAGGQVDPSDIKAKAKAIKSLIRERAQQQGIDLRLRRKRKTMTWWSCLASRSGSTGGITAGFGS